MENDIFNVKVHHFEQKALAVFRYQAAHIAVYQQYLRALKIKPENVKSLEGIPFMPIQFFKEHIIYPKKFQKPALQFESSGTGGKSSRHFIAKALLYDQSLLQSFEQHMGSVEDYHFLALLPSYLERKNASLVYMFKKLMEFSKQKSEDFFLNDFSGFSKRLEEVDRHSDKKIFIIGVSFALLSLAEKYPNSIPPDSILMETGGMKGRRKEMVRAELHEVLKGAFGLDHIYAEYGMTELLSQAYYLKDQKFHCPPWMRVKVREAEDPFSYCAAGKTGALNVIDLANLYSCSFIATDDVGRDLGNGNFDVLGRLDESDIRGCNLMFA